MCLLGLIHYVGAFLMVYLNNTVMCYVVQTILEFTIKLKYFISLLRGTN